LGNGRPVVRRNLLSRRADQLQQWFLRPGRKPCIKSKSDNLLLFEILDDHRPAFLHSFQFNRDLDSKQVKPNQQVHPLCATSKTLQAFPNVASFEALERKLEVRHDDSNAGVSVNKAVSDAVFHVNRDDNRGSSHCGVHLVLRLET
jgi:hypothetical protein